MSALLEAQALHVQYTAQLILWAIGEGYTFSWGQTKRTQAEADANAASGAGISHSLHLLGLAADLNLFKDGVDLNQGEDAAIVEAYRPLGDYWVTLDTNLRWGGNFRDAAGNPKPDSDHFSYTWQGIQ